MTTKSAATPWVAVLHAALVAATFASSAIAQERASIDEKYKWNLAEIYPSEQAWEKARSEATAELPRLSARKGTLGRSANELYRALTMRDAVGEKIARVSVYAYMLRDIDTRIGRPEQMTQQAEQLETDFNAAVAWMRPEVIRVGRDKIHSYIAADTRLKPYRHTLDDWLRYAPHALDPQREELLAQSGRIQNAGQTTWSIFTNADLPWPTVMLAEGKSVKLDEPTYEQWRESTNRADRDAVFRAFWTTYGQFTRTLGSTLNAQIQAHVFRNSARKFRSSVEAALFEDNIPVNVYSQLIDDVHRGLPTLHRYLKLRQRLLGVDRLRYEDLYAPLVTEAPRTFSSLDATTLVLRAVAPLGNEYVTTLERGLVERWTDWFPSTGKKSGAYSTMVYGLHPFQLQNFTGRYAEVSTLAHESGHSMHSYFAAKAQPYVTWRYPTFIAEIASTLNENLLVRAMLADAKSDDERLFLLGNWLEMLRTTLFRQVLFAEFELRIHQMVERGEPLTGDNLSALYLDVVRRYYGHDQGICVVDALYGAEWAYIPHFYFDFYVYQYATSVMASLALAEGIRNEAKATTPSTKRRDQYLAMLRAGGSQYPYEMLKNAGVDLASSAPFDAAMREMNAVIDQIEAILAKR